jgi:hypothetical protein
VGIAAEKCRGDLASKGAQSTWLMPSRPTMDAKKCLKMIGRPALCCDGLRNGVDPSPGSTLDVMD